MRTFLWSNIGQYPYYNKKEPWTIVLNHRAGARPRAARAYLTSLPPRHVTSHRVNTPRSTNDRQFILARIVYKKRAPSCFANFAMYLIWWRLLKILVWYWSIKRLNDYCNWFFLDFNYKIIFTTLVYVYTYIYMDFLHRFL